MITDLYPTIASILRLNVLSSDSPYSVPIFPFFPISLSFFSLVRLRDEEVGQKHNGIDCLCFLFFSGLAFLPPYPQSIFSLPLFSLVWLATTRASFSSLPLSLPCSLCRPQLPFQRSHWPPRLFSFSSILKICGVCLKGDAWPCSSGRKAGR